LAGVDAAIQVRDAWMRCRDGTRLVARIWSPDGPGSWPVLLMRQPYGRAIASTVTYAHPSWYASQGFVVVVQDVRGQGDSEGRFTGFRQEAADGADAVRWARELPESNGRLGTYGFSYQGLSQLLNDGGGGDSGPDAAALPDCTAPAMAGPSERDHWACEGGAHWWGLGLAWGLQLAAQQCRRRGDAAGWRELRASLQSGNFLENGPALLERHDPAGMAMGWLASDPTETRAWLEHPVAAELLLRPMLLIGGWYDPHLRGVLALWQRARAQGGSPRLHIGAWSHLNWQGGIDRRQLAFFREALQAPQAPGAGVEPAAAAIQLQCQSSHAWIQPAAAELVETRGAMAWGLRSGGLAGIDSGEGALLPAAAGAGRLTLVHDPWRAVPGRGGHLGLDAGPCQRGDLDSRSDVACFTSPPLTAPLHLLGCPLLQLRLEADQPGFDLCGALAVVRADGSVHQLSTGVLRQLGPQCLQPRPLALALQPLLARLEPGERLRLSLAGAAWPQIAVNPGTGALPRGAAGPEHRVISLRLHLEEARLELLPLNGCP
jgi:putative CocE/NonD family hydrolase